MGANFHVLKKVEKMALKAPTPTIALFTGVKKGKFTPNSALSLGQVDKRDNIIFDHIELCPISEIFSTG